MAETYDETIGRLRDEYDLDLTGIETQQDLKNALSKIDEGTKQKVKDNLTDINAVSKFFNESEEVQSQIVNTSISRIESTDSIQVINRLEKQAEVLPSSIEAEIVEQAQDRKVELIIESINREAQRDISLFEDLSPSQLKSPISPSGVTITTASASIVKEKILAGKTILPDDINF